jgi:hypothetical protein
MKRAKIFNTFFIYTLFLISCTQSPPSQNAENLFKEMYKECSMNEVLRISEMEPIYIGYEDIDFLLELMSDTSVIFPSGFNIHLFWFDTDQNKWVEEKNNIQYYPLDAKYILGKNDPQKEHQDLIFGVNPRIGTKRLVRIVVYGNVYENGIETEECAGAFADFEFSP